MRNKFRIILALAIFFALSGLSEAVIRNGSIRGKTGLSYSEIAYNFSSLNVTIRNRTKYNKTFGGSMLFLDKNYRVIARAELLDAKISRNSSRKYKAFFTKGTGNEAKAAKYLEWEFLN